MRVALDIYLILYLFDDANEKVQKKSTDKPTADM